MSIPAWMSALVRWCRRRPMRHFAHDPVRLFVFPVYIYLASSIRASAKRPNEAFTSRIWNVVFYPVDECVIWWAQQFGCIPMDAKSLIMSFAIASFFWWKITPIEKALLSNVRHSHLDGPLFDLNGLDGHLLLGLIAPICLALMRSAFRMPRTSSAVLILWQLLCASRKLSSLSSRVSSHGITCSISQASPILIGVWQR